MKKRKDGRYLARKMVEGVSYQAYGETKEEAYEKLRVKLSELTPKNRVATFGDIAAAWKEAKWETFSLGTRRCYQSGLNRALVEFGNVPVDKVTPMAIKELLNDLKSQDYSLKSVKTQKVVISTIYRHAMEAGTAFSNPATNVEIPKGLTKTTRLPPEDDEIERIKEYREWLYPLVLLYTGMRRGEALALTYEDIDFDNDLINVDKELLHHGNQPYLVYRTKTEAGKRKIPLIAPLKELLPKNKKGSLFGAPTARQFKTKWDNFCKAVDAQITPHQLRHAYATFLYDAGVEVKAAQKILGHSDLQMTMNIYTHIRESRLTDTTDKLNSFFK